jgi:regulator of protease activity HflC (stomatin/prohibitin superfamily)
VAEQTKKKTIIEAEGRARAVQVEGEAEGKKILAVGSATAEAYDKQVEAVGQLNLAAIEVTKSVAAAGLKITPDIMVGGGADGGGNIFAAFIAQLLASNRAGITGSSAESSGRPAGQT